MKKEERVDRRIQKTKKALNEALLSLMEKKKYEWITIQDILDHANVGRSTFYLHYNHKDELLVEGLTLTWEQILRKASSDASAVAIHERIIAFSLPAFNHAHEHKQIIKMLVGTRGWNIVREHLERILVRGIMETAAPYCKKRSISPESFEFFAYFLASGFLSVLTWWLNRKKLMPSEEINSLFRDMVVPMLKAHFTAP